MVLKKLLLALLPAFIGLNKSRPGKGLTFLNLISHSFHQLNQPIHIFGAQNKLIVRCQKLK